MPEVETLPTTLEDADKALGTVDEAPVPASPDAAPAAQPEPQIEGQPRDDQGRFAPKAPTAPETPAAPAASPSPSAETPAEPVASETETQHPTFSYQGDGQAVEVPGSAEGEDGIFIPATEVPRIKQLLAEGHAWNGSAQRYFNEVNTRQQQLETQVKSANEQREAVETQLTKILGHFESLVEASVGIPPEKLFESPLAQWLLDVRNGWGVLKAEAQAERFKRERESDQRRLKEYEDKQHEAELRPTMDRSLSDYVLHFGTAAGLDRPTMEKLYADLKSPQYEPLIFVHAPQDDPLHGIKKGELVIAFGVIEQEVARVARLLAPYKNGQVSATVTAGTPAVPTPKPPAPPVKKPTPPPTVSATRGPAPRKAIPEAKNLEDADRLLEEGGYDLD